MKCYSGEGVRRGSVVGIGGNYLRGRQVMEQPGTFSSGIGGMLGSETDLTAKQGDGLI